MRVGVLQTQVPFVRGGAERHSANLCEALRRHGHEVAEITLPFKWYPTSTLVDSIMAARLTDLSEVEGVPTDLMIGLRFPAYLARHPNKVYWIIHQYRQAYDQWEAGVSELLDDPEGDVIRHLVRAEDRKAFADTTHPIYANSKTVAQRLQTHLGQKATPLYHPPPNAELLTPGPFEDYLFAPGRLNPSKRPDLLLRALAGTASPLRLVIAGVAENPSYLESLKTMAQELGVSDRVEWLGGVDDEAMRAGYANARAVVFVPQDEDYGYITLEAMLSGKPVITTTDAGGPLEFITNGKQGLVSEAYPPALAESFEILMQDKVVAERMGATGYEHYHALNISWDHVVETLAGQSHPKDSLRPAMASDVAETNKSVSKVGDPQADAIAKRRSEIVPAQTTRMELPAGLDCDVVERMWGALCLADYEAQTGLVRIKVTNHSLSWWPKTDGCAVCVVAEWIGPDGVLRDTNVFVPLTDALGPGASQTLGFRLDPETETRPTRGALRLDLFQTEVGRFTDDGRANSVTLPCSEEAFIKLVRQGSGSHA